MAIKVNLKLKSSMSYIEPSQVCGVGLVLVHKDDLINNFVLAVTKQSYSLIGFYYTSRSTGRTRAHVILSDINGIVSSQFNRNYTIESLIKDPLTSKLAIRKLKPVYDESGCVDDEATKKRDGYFKAKIAEVAAKGHNQSIENWIKQLIGYDQISVSKGSTNVGLVNKVLLETGNWDKLSKSVPKTKSVPRTDLDDIPDTSEGKNKLFTILGNHLNQNVPSEPNISHSILNAYLVDNNILEPIQYLNLPPRNKVTLRLAQEKSIKNHRDFLTKAVSTFVQLTIEDPIFFSYIIKGINSNVKHQPRGQFQQNLIKMIDCSNDVVTDLVNMIQSGYIDKNRIDQDLKRYGDKLLTNLSSLNLEPKNLPGLPSKMSSRLIIVEDNLEPSNYDYNINLLGQELRKISTDLNNNSTPIININLLIQYYNNVVKLRPYDRIEPIEPATTKKSHGAIVTTGSTEEVKIELTTGKRILLPLVGYDLSKYSRQELQEILKFVNIISDRQPEYRELLGDLSDYLAR